MTCAGLKTAKMSTSPNQGAIEGSPPRAPTEVHVRWSNSSAVALRKVTHPNTASRWSAGGLYSMYCTKASSATFAVSPSFRRTTERNFPTYKSFSAEMATWVYLAFLVGPKEEAASILWRCTGWPGEYRIFWCFVSQWSSVGVNPP